MDCKNVVAVTDTTNFSSLLEEAALLVRQTLNIECPLIHVSCMNTISEVELYLIPFFEGETFDKVCETGVPIIGPAAMIFLLKQEILLPRRLKNGQHIYSLSLHGARVCCSNIDADTRDTLYKRVVAMGGHISTALTSDVTHLVVDEVGSMKYQYAVKLGIPIMSKEWITTLWQGSKTQVIKNDRVEEFKCPPFRGCTIVVTGLDVGQRSEVETLVQKHGGNYSGDLVMDKCTHLLSDVTEGHKFAFAMKWRIPCVRSAWFYDSIKKGVCLEIKEYQHTIEEKENCTASEDASYLSRPVLEETRDGANMSHLTEQPHQAVLRQLNNLDLDVTVNKDKGYLEGCRIFLSGFSELEQEQLKKIINNGGGTRLDEVSTRVTHIVTKTAIIKEIEQLSCLQPEAAVLSVQWLVDSMKKGRQQPEQTYNLLPTSQHVTPDNPLPTIRPALPQEPGVSILDQYHPHNTDSDVTLQPNNVTVTTSDVTTTAAMSTSDTTTAVDRTQAQNASVIAKSDLFNGYKFFIPSSVPRKIARNVQQQIISNGGCCRQDNIDFCVVAPFEEQPVCFPDKTHVTYMWLQRCIQAGEILSVTDCILYSPRHIPQPCTLLQGYVICYTQFAGFELAHLVKVVEVLGGVCQGTFTNKPIKKSKTMLDCQACTHLLYKRDEPQSSVKIKAAYKWKIPCVKIDWLYKCLETISVVDTAPYQEHKLGKKTDEKQMDCLRETATKIPDKLPTGISAITVTQKGAILKHDNDGFVTPMKVKPKNLIKVEGVMEALESPAPSHDTTLSSLNTLYKKNIVSAVRKTAPSSKILAGVTLVIKHSKDRKENVSEVKSVARRNGAVIKTYIDRTCTHVVCSVKEMKDANIEQAIKRGVKAVSHYWIMSSDEQGQRLSETEFHPGYDPKRALNISVSEDVEVAAVEIDNTQTDRQTQQGESRALHTQQPNVLEEPHSVDANLANEINMLENLVSSHQESEPESTRPEFVAPGTPRSRLKNKRSRNSRITPLDVPVEELLSQAPPPITYEDGQAAREALVAQKEDEAKRSATANSTTEASEATASDHDYATPTRTAAAVSCTTAATVQDDTLNNSALPNVSLAPTSSSTPNRNQNEMIQKQKLSDSEAKELVKDIDPSDLEFTADMSDTKEQEPNKQYIFLLTGMNESEKKEFGGIVTELGGLLLNSSGFDTRCTHLIATRPNRNEKYISAVGSGVWALHPTYLTASREQHTWAKENHFTWNNFAHKLKGINKTLALSASKWVGCKAFQEWRVILCINKSKLKSFRGIVESGGGCVLQDQPPYSVLSGTTHAFVDPTALSKSDISIAALVEAGVHCLKLEYIPEYLIHGDKQSKIEEYLLEPAKQLLNNVGSSNKRAIDTSVTGTPSKRHKT